MFGPDAFQKVTTVRVMHNGITSSSARRLATRGLVEIYDRLLSAYGPQGWWPAETATEVVIGAILTQNTAWRNVERAIANLREAGCLDFARLHALREPQIARLIRPAGTYRVKAARLKAFVTVLMRDHGGSLERLTSGDLEKARVRLLAIHGIGPETADAILLYAAGRASFVVDAYTRRILRRHALVDAGASYEAVRRLFHESVPPNRHVYNEYHALLVRVAKEHCRAAARCEGCPLAAMPHDARL